MRFVKKVIPFSKYVLTTCMTPDENCIMPTSGDNSISLAASSRQSGGTRVSESTFNNHDALAMRQIRARLMVLTDKDVVAQTDVAISPSSTICLKNFLEASVIGLSLIRLSPVFGTLD